jgi:dTDP-4-dehydrorhamnose 3,5-epimerase
MTLEPLALAGVHRMRFAAQADERGHFVRLWDRDLLAAAGLPATLVQMSAAFNAVAGTVRGLHFGWPPSRESKLVRCTRGRALDVLLDLRPHSPTYLRHLALELDADAPVTLVVPPGVAHGYQTLQDGTELHYAMDEAYRPQALGTVRFDDPCWGIRWPLPVSRMAARDREAPPFDEPAHRRRWLGAEVVHAA